MDNAFGSLEAFKEFLQTKEYRGGHALYNIYLFHPLDRKPFLEYEALELEDQIGFTPIRLPRPLNDRLVFHLKGCGTRRGPQEIPKPSGFHLWYETRFRICWLGNIVNKLLTGYWAPDAWIRADYDIDYDGNFILMVSGSVIPSQVFFSSHSQTFFHDMEKISSNEIFTFFSTGPGKGNGKSHFDYSAVESSISSRWP